MISIPNVSSNVKKKYEMCHLHGHTTYSLGDATTRIKDLVKRVKELGMKSVAITDHGTMAGIVEFWKECKKHDIKPIFGMEAYIAFGSAKDPMGFENPNGHIILLAKNIDGYRNLCQLLRAAAEPENFSHVPRIDLDLLQAHSRGLIGLTACVGGLPQRCMLGWRYYDRKLKERVYKDPQPDMVVPLVGKMKDIFEPNSFFLEVQNHVMSDEDFKKLSQEKQDDYLWLRKAQREVAIQSFKASQVTGVPMVVTNDFHYLSPEMAESRKAILAIGGRGFMDEKFQGKLADKRLLERSADSGGVHEVTGQMYVKSAAEMAEASHNKDYPFLMRNTMAVAEMVEHIDLSPETNERGLTKWNLPPVELQEGERPVDRLRAKVMEGFDSRYPGDSKYPWRTPEIRQEALERVEYELKVMENLGVESYHLMVADYVGHARSSDILVGPGRGSGAGSIVVYCLGITDLCPIRHGLLFERYLNPERASAADLDVDFDPARVSEIHQYCIDKYGEDNVARISAYVSLHAKGTLHGLGKVMCLNEDLTKDITSKLDDDQGEFRTKLEDVIEDRSSYAGAALRKFRDEAGEIGEKFFDIAFKLDDVKKSRSQHAAGIVISGTPLKDIVPLVIHNRDDPKSIATEIPYEHLEDLGLLKQDLLVVDGLTINDMALKYIRARHDADFKLPAEVDETYADEKALKVFSEGDLAGIWQMSSSGMRELCVALQPQNLEEIAAVCALYRPGPLDCIDEHTGLNMVDIYVRRKHKKLGVTYDHHLMENALRTTYGVIVFQEQIMQIARALCGWTYGTADYLRKAVAKKKPEQIAEQKDKFIPDTLTNTVDIDEETTRKIWGQIETFGKYGFNKSHSAAYGKLSYQMAYIKSRYPVEFLAAGITVASSKDDKKKRVGLLHDFCDEAARKGIKILAPDILLSKAVSVPEGESSIRLGFGAIRYVSKAATLLESSTVTETDSLTEAIRKTFDTGVNRTVLKALASVGAFDRFGDRATAIHTVEHMSDLRAKKTKKRMEEFFNLKDEELEEKVEIVPLTEEQLDTAALDYLYLSLEKEDTPPTKLVFMKWDGDPEFLRKLRTVPRGETEVILSVVHDDVNYAYSVNKVSSDMLNEFINANQVVVLGRI